MTHKYSESVKCGECTIINCKNCGYWHMYPMPSQESLNVYYKNKYYNSIINNRSMTDKKSDTDGFYKIYYEDKLRHIENFLPKNLPRTVMDIGTGYGDFLSFMKKEGWSVQGIEPSRESSNLNIQSGHIEEISNMKFTKSSVVTFNNVLEHLRNPERILLDVKECLLNPDGILSIAVPNDFSIIQDIQMKTILKDKNQYHWVTPDHLNYWSHETIKKFLHKLGFETLFITSTFPIDIFPLMGDDYINHPEIGKETHLKQVKFEKFLNETKNYDFKDKLYSSFAKIGIGRLILIYARIE